MNAKKRILIFGAGGFIGSAVCDALVKSATHEVFRVVSPRGVSEDSVGTYSADISDIESVRSVIGAVAPNVIINAAGRAHHREGESVEALFAANVDGVANLVRSAAESGVSRFVHLSSVMVYGNSHAPEISESNPTRPVGEYAQSKLIGEQVATKFATAASMPLTILRLAMVPAVKNYSNLRDLSEALSAGRFRWVGDGGNRKSMLTLKDLTDAIEAVVDSDVNEIGVDTFNLSSGSIPMREVVAALADGLGVDRPRTRLPIILARSATALFGGRFGIPTSERLTKFLSDDCVSAAGFSRHYRFGFSGDVREAILEYARQHRSNSTVDA